MSVYYDTYLLLCNMLLHIEDTAHTTGDKGVMPLAVRKDVAGSLVDADGDYSPLQVDGNGALRVNGTLTPSGTQDTNVIQLAGLAINLGSGVVGTGTQRVVIATDQSAIPVTNTGIFAVQSTNQANSGVDIGDVTINNTTANPIITTPEDKTFSTSTALEASRVVKASAGKFFFIQGYSTVAQFIQVHNTTSVPADTAVPIISFAVEAGKNFYFNYDASSRSFSTGISVCNSSTQATKTIGGATTWFDVMYI